MRVIHVITSLEAGGAQKMLTRIATHKRESEQIIVSLMGEGQYGSVLRQSGIETHYLGMRNSFSAARALFALSRLLNAKHPDIVMTWLYHADIMGLLATFLANRSPKRLIWNLRCSNIDFNQYSFGTRAIVKLLAWFSYLPGAVAFNSRAGQTHHTSLGYRPRRWIYLPNGLDTQLWRPDLRQRERVRADLGVSEDEILVGIVARVDPQKDHETFLRAAEIAGMQCNKIRFVLVGDGTKHLEIPKAIENNVMVLGYRKDVSSLITALDIHVLSSAFGEGFPNVICEAMACGIPCIATDVGQSAQILGDTGLVVSPGDPSSLAQALISLASERPEQLIERGKNSRERIISQFDIGRVHDLYRSTWCEVTNNDINTS